MPMQRSFGKLVVLVTNITVEKKCVSDRCNHYIPSSATEVIMKVNKVSLLYKHVVRDCATAYRMFIVTKLYNTKFICKNSETEKRCT